MKKYDAMRLSGTILLAHLALCAAFLLLLIAASGSTSTFTFRSPYGLVLGLLFIGLPAFAFGWGLRSAKDPFDKKLCWNAAMVLYVLNAAAFLLAPEFGTGNVIAMWWGVPMAPALAGLNAFAAPQSALYLFGGALLAAVEPLCLTLGLLSGRKQGFDAVAHICRRVVARDGEGDQFLSHTKYSFALFRQMRKAGAGMEICTHIIAFLCRKCYRTWEMSEMFYNYPESCGILIGL